MKLLNKEIEKRLTVKLDKSIKDDKVSGIMLYGAANDYPQVIEKLILGSQTAKACASIYAKFIAGDGFENESIGAIQVGVDNKGKPITLDNMRRKIAESLAMFHGVYIHCNENLDKEVGDTTLIPFKHCRLSREDDKGYCAKIAVHSNWTKEPELRKFNKNQVAWFDHFNLNEVVQQAQRDGKENFKGQIYTFYLDDTYLYPLSPFDSVYLDMDTEYQIQLFKNREIRNGMSDKIILTIPMPEDKQEEAETKKKTEDFMGPDGAKLLLFGTEFDSDGNLLKDGSYKVDVIKTNINDKLFENWEKGCSNNIRKAPKGIPAVLIDYEQGELSQASGEMVIQATNYYNALTQPMRKVLSEIVKDIYSHHQNNTLKGNQNWNLKPTTLITEATTVTDPEQEKLKSQAVLRGSVGGVTSLIALQQAVSEGKSDVEAAVATVVEIFGIPDATARKMIGTPKPSNPNNYVPNVKTA